MLIETAEVDVQELYRERWRELVRTAVLLVDDLGAAEDVVQDAFIGLHRRQGQLRSTDAALAYVRRSVLNGARSVLRKRRTVRRHLRAAAPLTVEAADDAVLRSVERQAALAAGADRRHAADVQRARTGSTAETDGHIDYPVVSFGDGTQDAVPASVDPACSGSPGPIDDTLTVPHTYTEPGSYQVTVTIGSCGLTQTKTLTIDVGAG